jgi:glyoxylase-like metal-dependent hydrolase (beta-lactamase superfamily II)
MPGPSRISRRSLLQSCGSLAASAVAGRTWAQGAITPSSAVPHRFTLGSREIIVLSDGYLELPSAFLAANVPEAELQSFLAGRGVSGDHVHFHINVALIRTAQDYVLIDAGSGGTWEPTAGKLADSLEAAGIKPQQIGTVVITHGHPDHLWGLIDEFDNSFRFPNAEYLVPAGEFDFWTSNSAASLSGPIEGIAAGARRVFKTVEARVRRIKPGEEVAPGILTVDTAGHTPGHISLVISSGSSKLLITADAWQNSHISFAHPDWQPRADMDGTQAATSRRRLLDMAATEKLSVLCYHIPFPGLGRVERKGTAFAWVT